MTTQRNQRSQRGLATETQRHRVFVGSAKEDLCVSVSLWLILSVSSTLVMTTQRNQRSQRGLATETQRHRVFVGSAKEDLCVSVSLWLILSVSSTLSVSRCLGPDERD